MEKFNMKRLLLALLCVACTGTAWAQSSTLPATPSVLPAYQPTYAVYDTRAIQTVSGGRFASFGCPSSCDPCPTACAQPCATNCATHCAAPCREPACIAVPAVKIVTKVCYSSTCEKVCFKDCSPFHCGHCDSGCDQGRCECHVYTQKYLVKRVHTTECPTTKCVPTNPCCDTCGHGHRGGNGFIYGQPAPMVETIPVQPMKK
jgi:hypothetical protein